jgi:hypothetical protein
MVCIILDHTATMWLYFLPIAQKMSATRCAPFWAESPSILWGDYLDFFPFHERARKCTTTALNSLTRFGIYLGILLTILYRDGVYLGITLGIAIIAVAAYYGMKQNGVVREGFQTEIVSPTLVTPDETPNLIGGIDVAGKPVADVIGQDRNAPTEANPFMNLLLNEIGKPAANVDTVARELSDTFQTRVYGDSGDVFQHNQNQRTWVTMPSTSIPNDRESFQNWLYRIPGRTCKEGNNAACRTGTENGNIPWLAAV